MHYAVSALNALEIWDEAFDDEDSAVSRYMRASALSVWVPYEDMIEECGLTDMQNADNIRELAARVAERLDRDSERREGVLQPIYEERARLNREAEAERVRLEREADLNHRKQIALMIGMLAALALTPAIVVGTVYRGRMKELHARIGGLETRMTEMRNEIAAERAALAGIQRAQETPAETETDSQPVPADTEKNRNESEV